MMSIFHCKDLDFLGFYLVRKAFIMVITFSMQYFHFGSCLLIEQELIRNIRYI